MLVFGDRGTGKSTAVRALAALLPPMRAVVGCRYGCDPAAGRARCERLRARAEAKGAPKQSPGAGAGGRSAARRHRGSRRRRARSRARAGAQGVKAFEPGLLARANRGFLYIDEVNLLEDHLVDLLIDVAASGENVVEREGLSVRHPARFVLVGSGNPEEGELRPQLLDRFGLSVEVRRRPTILRTRVEVVRRRDEFERDPAAFSAKWKKDRRATAHAHRRPRTSRLPTVQVPDAALERAAQLCMALGTDGLRGELTLMRAARALASFDGDSTVSDAHLRQVAPAALRHRLRRNPLDEAGSTIRVTRVIEEVMGATEAGT